MPAASITSQQQGPANLLRSLMHLQVLGGEVFLEAVVREAPAPRRQGHHQSSLGELAQQILRAGDLPPGPIRFGARGQHGDPQAGFVVRGFG